MGDELANTVQTDIDENRPIDHTVNVDRSIKGFEIESSDIGINGDTHSLTSSELNVETGSQETCMTNPLLLKRTRADVAQEDDEVNSKKIKHGNEDQEDVNAKGPAKNTTNQTRGNNEEIENTDARIYKTEADNCEEDKGSNSDSDVDTDITGADEQESEGETNEDDDIQSEIVAKDSSASKPPARPEADTFPKLYRLLRSGETVSEGLVAKDPDASVSVATHVATGSSGNGSQYISTCSKLWAAENFRGLKTRKRCRYRYGVKDIVEIDVGQLPMSVNIIDLTTDEKRKQHEIWNKEINEKFHRFASSHQEVLLVGKVPPECLKLIPFTGTVPDSDESDYDYF